MTNFTNEQLEAWAGLGPWHRETDQDEEATIPDIYICDKGTACDATVVCTLGWNTELDKRELDAALIAAAPALAAALLAERKAREVEVGELRAAAEDLVSLCSADVKMNGTTYQPMPYRSAFTKAVERVIEALKGQTP